MQEIITTYHVAVPTAFHDNEELDVLTTLAHTLSLQEAGLSSILVCGSTGEQHSLTLQEKLQLVTAIDNEHRFNPQMEILFGVAGIRQTEVLELVNALNSVPKIAGILLGFPPYILPTQAEAVSYVEQVMAISEKPIILYNNPRRTGFDLSLEALVHLAKSPQIVGLKEAGDSRRVPEIIEQVKPTFFIYAGGEVALSEKIALGYTRLSSILGNLYPREIEHWFQEQLRGELTVFPYETALTQLNQVNSLVYLKNQISSKEGLPMGKPRGPLGN